MSEKTNATADALVSYAEFYDQIAEVLLGEKNPLPSTNTDHAMIEKVLTLQQRVQVLEAEIASLRQRLDTACHVQADDKVGFDWAVLDEIFSLRALNAALERMVGEHWADNVDALERAEVRG